jgi:hypothetical protein
VYDVTGALVWNAFTRAVPQITTWSYDGPALVTNHSPAQTADPVTPFFDDDLTHEIYHAAAFGAGETYWGTTDGQLFQLASSFNLDVSVGLDLGHGVSVNSSILDYTNSISNGGGSSWTLTVWAYVPSTGTMTYVWAYVQPGTTNQVGLVVHAWSGPACP